MSATECNMLRIHVGRKLFLGLSVTELSVDVQKPTTEGGAAPVAAVQAKRKRQKDYYSSLLTKYEWMIEMPEDLGPSWRVMARPEGKRCLVVAGRCLPSSPLPGMRLPLHPQYTC